ncbi:MAG: 4Fe-4S binding protein [Bacteroidota bacterium]
MKELINYFSGLFKGIKSLLTGMTVTGSYFFRPWTIVTQQYPENRKKLIIPERSKGNLIMPHNSQNQHRCTGCGICELNCPNGTIEVIAKNEINAEGKKRKVLDQYVYKMGMCSFCGLCIKVCPSNALTFSPEFEHAVFSRAKLNKILNNEGSTLTKDVE